MRSVTIREASDRSVVWHIGSLSFFILEMPA